MAAAMNGMALHKGVIPYGGTFLVFSDYCRPAIRLAALMGQRVIFVLTHDSIGLGEDGPTHQPIEHLAALRAIPNLAVFRPADAVETAECWACALVREDGPSALVLTRQNLPALRTAADDVNRCGARRLCAARGRGPARGDAARDRLRGRDRRRGAHAPAGLRHRLRAWSRCPASSCSTSRTRPIVKEVLGGGLRIAVEAAAPFGWTRYVRSEDDVVGMTGFGASAPAQELYEHFGITPERIVELVRRRL